MDIKRCEICGKLYDCDITTVKDNGFRLVHIDGIGIIHDKRIYECCPDCITSIKEYISFLESRKVGSKGKTNTCVCCGEEIPEGRHTCLNCERISY